MTKLWVIVLLLALGGCTKHPDLLSVIDTSDIPALRAFQRACLEKPRRFVYLKEVGRRETQPLRWRMSCMENADIFDEGNFIRKGDDD
jgi:hypothetical protein